MGNVENVILERQESRDGGGLGAVAKASRVARTKRAVLWPAEVRATYRRDVFCSHRQLVGLRALGLSVDSVRFEIRSRRGYGVYVIGGDHGAHGKDLSEATAALVKMLAPDIEAVTAADDR
jgi:hypothetical protein